MVLKQTSQCIKDERGRSKETAETLTAQGVAETNTLSRPFNWAYEVCGRDHSGLSVPAFYERIFEQAILRSSKAEVIASFMRRNGYG